MVRKICFTGKIPKKRKKEVFIYILFALKGFREELEKRFIVPDDNECVVGMDKNRFMQVSNKHPIGKKIILLLKQYRKETNPKVKHSNKT